MTRVVPTARRAVLELTVAVVALAGCVWSWLASASQVEVAPITDGEPPTTSITYYAPLLFVSLLCATVTGVLIVLALTRLRRRRHTGTP